MLKRLASIALVSIILFSTGCSLYRPSLQQGNFITQEDLDRLKPGLSKHQVQQIMGTTALTPLFNLDQWNYSYGYIDGQHRDQPIKFKTISLYFKKDALTSYSSRFWHPANLPKQKSES